MKEERIGTPRRNLVLETAGSIRVLVGDKYYTLDFQDKKATKKDGSPAESNFVVTSTIDDYLNGTAPYPGDGKVIFALYSGIYYTNGGSYYVMSSGNQNSQDTIDNTITFLGSPAFKVNSVQLINNLNADLLDGYHASDFAKKDDLNQSFEKIETIDGKFTYKDGVLTIPSLNCENINSDVITFNKLNGPITLGIDVDFSYSDEFIKGKKYNNISLNYDINLLSILLDIYYKYSLEESILELVSKLFTLINTDLTFAQLFNLAKEYDEDDLLEELVDSEIYVAPILSSDEWNKKLSDGTTLKDHILKNVYTGDLSDYEGAVFELESDNLNNLYPGYKFSAVKVSEGEERGVTNLIITGIDVENNKIYVKSDWQTFAYQNTISKTDALKINDLEFNVFSYEYEDDLDSPDEELEIEHISDIVGYIGDYDGLTNDNLFLKLRTTGGFIGLDDNNNPFLEIDSNGRANIKSKADLVDGKIPVEQLPSNISGLDGVNSKLVLQFSKDTSDTDPVINYKHKDIDYAKNGQNWWNGNIFSMVIDKPSNALIPTVIVQGNNSQNAFYSCNIINTLGSSLLEIRTFNPGEYATDMEKKYPFTATIYFNYIN